MGHPALLKSFQEYDGFRGAHFYGPDGCRFLPWAEVVQFVNKFPSPQDKGFSDKLLGMLANYDPDNQFLALNASDSDRLSIELYEKNNAR